MIEWPDVLHKESCDERARHQGSLTLLLSVSISLPRPKQSVIADTVVLRIADSVLLARGSQISKLQTTSVAGPGNPGFRKLQGFQRFRRFQAFQGKPLLGEAVLQTNPYTFRPEHAADPSRPMQQLDSPS